jgi:hypothetical protein
MDQWNYTWGRLESQGKEIKGQSANDLADETGGRRIVEAVDGKVAVYDCGDHFTLIGSRSVDGVAGLCAVRVEASKLGLERRANPAAAIQAAHPRREAQAVAEIVGEYPGKWSEARSRGRTGWRKVTSWLRRLAEHRDGPVTMRTTVEPDGTVSVVVESAHVPDATHTPHGRIVNLTPHEVVVVREHGSVVYPSVGFARVPETREPGPDGVSTLRLDVGQVEGLPPQEEGVRYIVSLLTAVSLQAGMMGRTDLLVVGPLIRDGSGRIVGCSGLSRLAEITIS